ncbi:hypothetical protein EMIHUDRAFT_435744 [Emiliania huxleyi CCMP1516]|uniref:Uncharacterized protein n=2 Tax=Emiliania huxleyi TaxID=2903 RepID=A0A0D3JBP0_EMIH1|nr:hypothetical protein EMIHUDRAFT_435744 [Emiliania huxleyi CCMP1516]EOD20925.1 hypothetical protein EMIHUDRAFT_435744 [Emiliania huxleyi CCMP1516]|eukprot:XP_005773354.1 hypothetical protein EMIHUDRAFT_435744 [Emiliania huxleyi CCMP1516]
MPRARGRRLLSWLLLQLCSAQDAAGPGELRHGLVFDAGSSGTRVHVYSWKIGGGGSKDSFDLIADDLLKIKPGLSSFKGEPEQAGASLRPLLAYAKEKVPAAAVPATPVFLMATAGLRLVGEGAKDAILASVCDELGKSGFRFRCEWATLLGGEDEGLYGWVTVNYLLGALYPPAKTPAVGTIDLGGGSVQVVFATSEPVPNPDESQLLTFGARQHSLYVKSHLGYGLDEARRKALDSLVSRRAEDKPEPFRHPCLPRGASLEHGGKSLVGDADWARCLRVMGRLFPQPFAAGQPKLADRFYGFSYMYDRTAAIGLLDGQPRQFGSVAMSYNDIAAAGESLCRLSAEETATRFANTQDAAKSNNYCGDVAYVAALLKALGFEGDTSITMTNKIEKVELVWTLGAMLAKSAELLADTGSGGLGAGSVIGGLVALGLAAAALKLLSQRRSYSKLLPSSRRDFN